MLGCHDSLLLVIVQIEAQQGVEMELMGFNTTICVDIYLNLHFMR
jgi:hypothetical protein